MGIFGKKSDPTMGTRAFLNMANEEFRRLNQECLNTIGTSYNRKHQECKQFGTQNSRMHSGGNVRRSCVYRVLSGEIVIPAKFRKGLGHKRIVDLIAKNHQGPIPRAVKVGGSRGGRISKNGPMFLYKGDVVISRGQRKGLTFGQIINLIHG